MKSLDKNARATYIDIKKKVFDGLDTQNKEGRLCAWLFLLGIDIQSPETETLRQDYWLKYLPT